MHRPPDDPHGTISAPGWEALDAAMLSLYPHSGEPHQFTSQRPYDPKAPHPLPAITVFEAPGSAHRPAYWHYLSYGLSELFEKTTDDQELSGFGFELSLALPREVSPSGESVPAQPPIWGINLISALASYVLREQEGFDSGHCVDLGRPLDGSTPDPQKLSGCLCVPDPQLSQIQSPFGRVVILRLIGLDPEEIKVVKSLELAAQVSLIKEIEPLGLTSMQRSPWIQDPQKQKIWNRYRLGLSW